MGHHAIPLDPTIKYESAAEILSIGLIVFVCGFLR